jgi:hypothetical protein
MPRLAPVVLAAQLVGLVSGLMAGAGRPLAPLTPLAPLRAPALPAACPRMMCADAPVTVKHFVKDLEFLGPCRFVVVGDGAILEAIGAVSPGRLQPAPLSSSQPRAAGIKPPAR